MYVTFAHGDRGPLPLIPTNLDPCHGDFRCCDMVPGTEKTSLCLDLASSSDGGSLFFHSLETQSVQCLRDHRVCENVFEFRKKVRGKDQSSLLNNRFYARLPNVVLCNQAQRERSSFGMFLCYAVKGWVQTLTTLCCTICTLQASLSGTLLQTLPDLVTPLKGHPLSPRSCPPTRSAPSERFGY